MIHIPEPVSDSLFALLFAFLIFVAKKLRGKITDSDLVQQKLLLDRAKTETARALTELQEKLIKEHQERERAITQSWEVEEARWEERDVGLRQTVNDLIEQSKINADLYAISLEQLRGYVNRLLDENSRLRVEGAESQRHENDVRRELETFQQKFDRQEEVIARERQTFKNTTHELQRRLRDMVDRGVQKGVVLTGTDVLPPNFTDSKVDRS